MPEQLAALLEQELPLREDRRSLGGELANQITVPAQSSRTRGSREILSAGRQRSTPWVRAATAADGGAEPRAPSACAGTDWITGMVQALPPKSASPVSTSPGEITSDMEAPLAHVLLTVLLHNTVVTGQRRPGSAVRATGSRPAEASFGRGWQHPRSASRRGLKSGDKRMRYEATDVAGVFVLHPEPYVDPRGVFARTWDTAEAGNSGWTRGSPSAARHTTATPEPCAACTTRTSPGRRPSSSAAPPGRSSTSQSIFAHRPRRTSSGSGWSCPRRIAARSTSPLVARTAS